jgi:circadian clock protein KaiC
MHLASMHKAVREFEPDVVIIDPITNLISAGSRDETKNMLLRLVDFLKSRGITAMFTSLTHSVAGSSEESELGVSSLMDTWLLLRDIETGGERNRGINVVKSRGMRHSNQVREFIISSDGIELRSPYLGQTGILTGSARLAEEMRAHAEEAAQTESTRQLLADFELKRRGLQARIDVLLAEIAAGEEALRRARVYEADRSKHVTRAQVAMQRSRNGRSSATPARTPGKGVGS